MNKTKDYQSINIFDFKARRVTLRVYKVTYTSPITRKSWSALVRDIELMNVTLLSTVAPKTSDLRKLKKVIKSNCMAI